jgi:hypothetical protein
MDGDFEPNACSSAGQPVMRKRPVGAEAGERSKRYAGRGWESAGKLKGFNKSSEQVPNTVKLLG